MGWMNLKFIFLESKIACKLILQQFIVSIVVIVYFIIARIDSWIRCVDTHKRDREIKRKGDRKTKWNNKKYEKWGTICRRQDHWIQLSQKVYILIHTLFSFFLTWDMDHWRSSDLSLCHTPWILAYIMEMRMKEKIKSKPIHIRIHIYKWI